MLKYVQAAFWARPRIAGLGDVPLLAVGAGAFLLLGLIHPAIWLLGVGVIGGLTFGLASSPRFRTAIDAAEGNRRKPTVGAAELEAQLDRDSRRALDELCDKCQAVLTLYREQGADDAGIRTTAEALDKLRTLSVRLLHQKQRLLDASAGSQAVRIRASIEAAERELRSDGLTESVRNSRTATLELLRKRLSVAEQREVAISEITSDLQRIRTQIELALDEAALRSKPVAVSTRIELASQMLDARLFGNSTGSIDLDDDLVRSRT